MPIYVITYVLSKEESSDDYRPLMTELLRLRAHRYQRSAWLANLTGSPKAIHDHLKKLMVDTDSLLVCEFTSVHHGSGLRDGTAKWLETNAPGGSRAASQ